MDTLKGALAFPLHATVAWLIWVRAQLLGPNGLLAALFGLAARSCERTRSAGRIGGLLGRAVAVARWRRPSVSPC